MSRAGRTAGLDFSIHAEIMAVRNRSAAALLASEDIQRLELADRIVVLFQGRLVYEVRASEWASTEIGRHRRGIEYLENCGIRLPDL